MELYRSRLSTKRYGNCTIQPTMPIQSFEMKRLLVPWSLGVNAARHIAWYVSYQVSGETRPRR
jgi:hypothetical protein